MDTHWILVDPFPPVVFHHFPLTQMAVGGASRVACLVGAMLSPKDGRRWARVERWEVKGVAMNPYIEDQERLKDLIDYPIGTPEWFYKVT